MALPTPAAAGNVPAPSEPAAQRQVPYKKLLFWLLPAATANYALFQGLQAIILPHQIEMIDPAEKVTNLGLITALSGIAAVAGLLAGGTISDRTVSRWGKRTPSLVVAAAASALVMTVMADASTVVTLAVFACALWFFANYYQAVMTAILPDQVPLEHRGIGASVLAIGVPLGVLVGVNIAAQTSQRTGYLSLAALLVLTTLCFAAFAREPASTRAARPAPASRIGLAGRLRGFFGGFRSRDFTLAFVGRAFMFFAIFSVTGYTYYILQDYVGTANLPGGNVQTAVSIMISIQMIACIISTAASGWLTDKVGRPKLLVVIASLGMAAAMVIPLFSATWPAMVVMQTLVGLFFGAYMAIDLALMTMVLPDPDAEGRDMAILAVAVSGPQIFSPAAAAAVIAGLGYPALFGFGAVSAVAGGIAVLAIKSVR
jgi:MFS family permease